MSNDNLREQRVIATLLEHYPSVWRTSWDGGFKDPLIQDLLDFIQSECDKARKDERERNITIRATSVDKNKPGIIHGIKFEKGPNVRFEFKWSDPMTLDNNVFTGYKDEAKGEGRNE